MIEFDNFYLIGIKGVAMTALACCLADLRKNIRGSDVPDNFVTQKTLDFLNLKIDIDFKTDLPKETQVVIFSGANGGSLNPQVIQAKSRGLLVLSHARALAELFNLKKGVAVCGVGGKSSISAMLTWACEKIRPESYSVGVGEILGLSKTGQFLKSSEYFIAEADEYVEDPAQKESTAGQIIPRFSFLKPQITICTSLRFDHPDVYRDFEQTKWVYFNFFLNIKPNGTLIYYQDDKNLSTLVSKLKNERPDIQCISYGLTSAADFNLQDYELKLQIPGQFNQLNALAAFAAGEVMNLPAASLLVNLQNYRSVKRRFEFIGEKNGVLCWDDYAHHPAEVKAAIEAMQAWYPNKRLVIAFQSHTFSRTKQLFDEFVAALATNSEIIMIDIFPSAREAQDDSINSTMLCQAIVEKYPGVKAVNLYSLSNLKKFLNTELKAGEVFLTLGAGDIYQIYQ